METTYNFSYLFIYEIEILLFVISWISCLFVAMKDEKTDIVFFLFFEIILISTQFIITAENEIDDLQFLYFLPLCFISCFFNFLLFGSNVLRVVVKKIEFIDPFLEFFFKFPGMFFFIFTVIPLIPTFIKLYKTEEYILANKSFYHFVILILVLLYIIAMKLCGIRSTICEFTDDD